MAATRRSTQADATLDRVVGHRRGSWPSRWGATGGPRAPLRRASLERDLGLGSLERVELLTAAGGGVRPAPRRRRAAARHPGRAGPRRRRCGRRRADPCASTAPRPRLARAAGRARSRAYRPRGPLPARARRARPAHASTCARRTAARTRSPTAGSGARPPRWREACASAASARGDTVALMLPTGTDFLRPSRASSIAGAVPVPIYPPVRLDRLEEYAQRQSAILADAGVRAARHDPAGEARRRALRPRCRACATSPPWRDLAGPRGVLAAPPRAGPEDPAFIQYTSGSTGRPKGVLLTHANLLANIEAIGRGLEVQPTDVGASWLPLYHDMGLIGSWLFCHARRASRSRSSRPCRFLARPERWLWTIHERRATLSAAPNFAYELCVRTHQGRGPRRPRPLLLALRAERRGAGEPRDPGALRRAASPATASGREAMLPVYGLAENSVALCLPARWAADRGSTAWPAAPSRARAGPSPGAEPTTAALRFVSVGRAAARARGADRRRGRGRAGGARGGPPRLPRPLHDRRLLPQARGHGGHRPARAVGSTAATSPTSPTARSTSRGGARTSSSRAGRNLVPQEIEEAAASVAGHPPGLRGGLRRAARRARDRAPGRRGRDARHGCREARDRLVRDGDRRVAGAVEVPPDVVALVPPGAVPKTSSRQDPAGRHARPLPGGPAGPRAPHLARATPRTAGRWPRPPHAVRPCSPARDAPLYTAWLALALPVVAVPLWLLAAMCPRAPLRLRLRPADRAPLLFLRRAAASSPSSGLEHLRRPGALVLCSNHSSYVDTPVLMAALPHDFLFVAKKEVLGYPVIGTYVRRAGHLTVDRFDFQQGVADAAARAASRWAGARRCCSSPKARSRRPPACGRSAWAPSRPRWRRARPSCPWRSRARARSCVATGSCPPRAAFASGSARPLLPKGEGWHAVVALRDRVAEAIAAHCGEPRLDLVAARTRAARSSGVRGPAFGDPTCSPSTTCGGPGTGCGRTSLLRPLRRSFALREQRGFSEARVLAAHGLLQGAGRPRNLSSLTPKERARGIVAASAGNHALGVAFAAASPWGRRRRLRSSCPAPRPGRRSRSCARFPVEVREEGRPTTTPRRRPWPSQAATGATYVHAFDDPRTARRPGHLRPRDPGRSSRTWARSWCRWAAAASSPASRRR